MVEEKICWYMCIYMCIYVDFSLSNLASNVTSNLSQVSLSTKAFFMTKLTNFFWMLASASLGQSVAKQHNNFFYFQFSNQINQCVVASHL